MVSERLHSYTDLRSLAISQSSKQNPMAEYYSNPLYLHSSDTPSVVLVSSVLTGPNYNAWSRSMKMVLRVWNKWGIVSGGVPTPLINHPNYETWDRCDVMVSSWILRTVSEQIAESILYIDSAKEIWDDLANKFFSIDPYRISNLHDEINNLK